MQGFYPSMNNRSAVRPDKHARPDPHIVTHAVLASAPAPSRRERSMRFSRRLTLSAIHHEMFTKACTPRESVQELEKKVFAGPKLMHNMTKQEMEK